MSCFRRLTFQRLERVVRRGQAQRRYFDQVQLIVDRRVAVIFLDVLVSELLRRKVRVEFPYRLTLSRVQRGIGVI